MIIRQPGKWCGPPDTPGTIAARERFEAAVNALGALASITIHVAICDLDPSVWGVPVGQRNDDALAVLRLALAVLGEHYSRRLSRPPRSYEPRMVAPMAGVAVPGDL